MLGGPIQGDAVDELREVVVALLDARDLACSEEALAQPADGRSTRPF